MHIVAASPAASLMGVLPVTLQLSTGLTAFLAQQPPCTVAIDYPASFPIRPTQIVRDHFAHDHEYEDALLAAIAKSGHEVAFVDSVSFLERQEKLLLLAFDLAPKGLNHYCDNRPTSQNSGLTDESSLRALYRLSVDAFYTREIARTNYLIEQIAALKPGIAICGHRVARALYWRSEELGLPVESYSEETSELFGESHFEAKAIPEQESAIEKTVKRAFNAVEHGRITPEKTPQFIGTWREEVPAEGLFELYINGVFDGKVYGNIEDALGSASFVGRITQDRIAIQKWYDEQAHESGALREPITYEGSLNGARFTGKYTCGPERGEFWLAPFTEELAREITIPQKY